MCNIENLRFQVLFRSKFYDFFAVLQCEEMSWNLQSLIYQYIIRLLLNLKQWNEVRNNLICSGEARTQFNCPKLFFKNRKLDFFLKFKQPEISQRNKQKSFFISRTSLNFFLLSPSPKNETQANRLGSMFWVFLEPHKVAWPLQYFIVSLENFEVSYELTKSRIVQ